MLGWPTCSWSVAIKDLSNYPIFSIILLCHVLTFSHFLEHENNAALFYHSLPLSTSLSSIENLLQICPSRIHGIGSPWCIWHLPRDGKDVQIQSLWSISWNFLLSLCCLMASSSPDLLPILDHPKHQVIVLSMLSTAGKHGVDFFPFLDSYEVVLTLDKNKHEVVADIHYYIFNTLLFTLLILHIYWWVLIVRMLMKQIKTRGMIGNDVRSGMNPMNITNSRYRMDPWYKKSDLETI